MSKQAQFKAEIEKWIEKENKRGALIQKKVTFDLHREIMKRTPVDTGRARAGWMVSLGAPSTYLPPEGDKVSPPEQPNIETDGIQSTFIINNVSYIKALDEGHSQQAPNGMVKLAVAKVRADMAKRKVR